MDGVLGTAGRAVLSVRGIKVEIIDRGSGRPIVFLHADEGAEANGDLLSRLGSMGRVIAPSHPGFGRSDLPPEFKSVDDLAYFYLTLFDDMKLDDAVLVGASFGGWIAAEIAIRTCKHISHLVLCGAFGIRVARDETAVDIQDVFTLPQDEIDRRLYAQPELWRARLNAASDEDFHLATRNREALCLYGWSPYMHNPVLRRWLSRIAVPTLVLWGERDGIVSPDYGRAFAGAIPGARFHLIENAAHRCYLERPDRVAREIADFAGLRADMPEPVRM